jgi:hypothetical protein
MRLLRLARPACLLAAATLAVAVLVSPASRAAPSAQQKADARALVAEADKAMKAQRWADAVGALRKGQRLDPSPAIELELAGALSASGKLVEARKVLARLAADDDAKSAKKREAAKKALSELEERLPTVKVTIAGPPADQVSVTLDGIDVNVHRGAEIPVNPGQHTVAASADGFQAAEKEVRLAEGAHEEVELTLASKDAKDPPAPVATESESKHGSRIPGVSMLLLGAAGLGTASVFGVIALEAGSGARAQCTNNLCPPAAGDDLHRARTFGDASTVAFVAGGALAAAGIVLTIAAPGATRRRARACCPGSGRAARGWASRARSERRGRAPG